MFICLIGIVGGTYITKPMPKIHSSFVGHVCSPAEIRNDYIISGGCVNVVGSQESASHTVLRLKWQQDLYLFFMTEKNSVSMILRRRCCENVDAAS